MCPCLSKMGPGSSLLKMQAFSNKQKNKKQCPNGEWQSTQRLPVQASKHCCVVVEAEDMRRSGVRSEHINQLELRTIHLVLKSGPLMVLSSVTSPCVGSLRQHRECQLHQPSGQHKVVPRLSQGYLLTWNVLRWAHPPFSLLRATLIKLYGDPYLPFLMTSVNG